MSDQTSNIGLRASRERVGQAVREDTRWTRPRNPSRWTLNPSMHSTPRPLGVGCRVSSTPRRSARSTPSRSIPPAVAHGRCSERWSSGCGCAPRVYWSTLAVDGAAPACGSRAFSAQLLGVDISPKAVALATARIPEFFPAGLELEAKVDRPEESGRWDRLNDLWEAHEQQLRHENGDAATDAKLAEARNHRPERPYRITSLITVRARPPASSSTLL